MEIGCLGLKKDNGLRPNLMYWLLSLTKFLGYFFGDWLFEVKEG
ncbi:hypothetical protein [Clostridium felsineum]|nr:hypothetical protein [Clostridium felsineum]